MKDLASLLFNVGPSYTRPEAGRILVAEPFLKEAFYTHGVAFVIDYLEDEGATGVILNNPTEYHLADLLDGVSAEASVRVYCGGPSGQDRLFFIHTLGTEIIADARCFAPGLYVGGNFDDAVRYINDGYPADGCIRFFLGHVNWAEGQLEREISRGRWTTLPDLPLPEAVLAGSGDAMWHRMVRALGPDYRSWSLLPRNPVCN